MGIQCTFDNLCICPCPTYHIGGFIFLLLIRHFPTKKRLLILKMDIHVHLIICVYVYVQPVTSVDLYFYY